VGNGARTSDASDLLLKLSKRTNIPILTTMMAVDLAQDDNHLGFIGTHGNRVANMIINECDLIISVGARLGLRQVGRYTHNFAPKADLIRCDIDEYELSRNIKNNEKKYQIDARDFLTMLLNEDIPDYSVWKKQCLDVKKILDNYDKTEGNLVIERISSLLPPNPIVTVDVGQNQCWAAQSLLLKGNEGRILIGGGYGTMGCGLPYAIGASIANNNSLVYCICGDGGFQMNIQELETIKRENLPIKIFVLNNKVLGKISETQHYNHNDRYAQTTAASGYTVPDFEKISQAYGIKATTLESYQQLADYQECFIDKNPYLFNIMMSEESYLVPKVKWETGVMKPDLPYRVLERCQEIFSQ